MKCYREGDTKAILYYKITPERLELDVLYKKWQSALVGGASTNALIDRRELRRGNLHQIITAHYIIDQHDHRHKLEFIYRRRWRLHFALDVHRPLSPTYNPYKREYRMGLFSTAFVARSTSTSFHGGLDSKPNLDLGLYLPRRRSCTNLVGASSKTLVAWSSHSRYTGREKDTKRVSQQ